MSSHHHHCHSAAPPSPQPCCRCCSSAAPIPPPSSASDQLLQAIAIHLLQPPTPVPQPPTQPTDHNLLLSLNRRVAALESYVSFTNPQAPPPRSHHQRPRPGPRWDAYLDDLEQPKVRRTSDPDEDRRAIGREFAARTIQLAFRRFLICRSRALRQLRELAVIRSHTAALRGSVASERMRGDHKQAPRLAMELLLRLERIQECDPMVRERKRAIHRELSLMLDFVDNVLVNEQEKAFSSLEISDGRMGSLLARAGKPRFAGVVSRRASPKELEDELESNGDEMEGPDVPGEVEGRKPGWYRVSNRNSGPGGTMPKPVGDTMRSFGRR